MTDRPMSARRVAIGAVLAATAVLTACAPQSPTSQEQQLAQTLDSKLEAAGLRTVSESTAVSLYGTDGGISCENAGNLQNVLALSEFGNLSGNLRRIIMDPAVIKYDLAVISTYCPDKLPDYDDLTGSLSTEQTISQN